MTSDLIHNDEFALAMQAFAPFERTPELCVAVSGGADSMALVLLADRWARQHGGRVVALTIDHGLRANSSDEALLVGRRLAALGIAHEILTWDGAKPSNGLQAAARGARYQLLDNWCRQHGFLHLLIAHHADDQAETFLMRVERGSGPDGLAAMAPVRTLKSCRLLRPLLAFPKQRLIATLEAADVEWVDDPSNVDARFGRTLARRELQSGAIDTAGLTEGVARFQRIRTHLENETSCWLAGHTTLSPFGTLRISEALFDGLDEEIRLRVLSRAAMTIGGNVYPPSIAAIERLAAKLQAGESATLGGALFAEQGTGIVVYREARNLPAEMPVARGIIHWDRRFQISAGQAGLSATILPWSDEIARNWDKNLRPAWYSKLGLRTRQGLPIVRINGEFRVPDPQNSENFGISMRFSPIMPLSGGGFSVA